MSMEQKTVVQTIQDHYNDIFSAEKRVADFIIAFPERAVNANVSEIARLSGVSDATVVRMCQHIGYKGYYQMRIFLSRDIGSQKIEADALDAGEASASPMATLLQRYAKDILLLGGSISQETMLQCAKLIVASGQVHIAAVGNTATMAQYMGFRLGRVGIRCSYNMTPEYFINHINLADPGDVVLAISKSGSSKQVVQGMELAKERGLKTIAVTGHQYSPVSNLADYVLVSSSEGLNFKSYSLLAELAVLDLLVSCVQQIGGQSEARANKPELVFSEYKA